MDGKNDLISRWAAIEAFNPEYETDRFTPWIIDTLKDLPSAQPEIIRCKDCKFYTPMNRETKTGICNVTMHQNFGDEWYCAGAERRTDG